MPFNPSPPALFPTYLLPTLPFRQRRQSSVSSSSSSSSTISTSPPHPSPLLTPDPTPYLSGHASHLRCARCLADLALSTQIISKGFTGRHGRAYLVSPTDSSTGGDPRPNLPNTVTHKPVPRQLVTGAHTVADIQCAHCFSVLGWKYVAAAEEAQRYKVGKVILETKRVCRSSNWEDWEGGAGVGMGMGPGLHGSGLGTMVKEGGHAAAKRGEDVEEAVEFDSQDEDECEDLFMGVWTPRLAMKRRKGRRFGQEIGEEE